MATQTDFGTTWRNSWTLNILVSTTIVAVDSQPRIYSWRTSLSVERQSAPPGQLWLPLSPCLGNEIQKGPETSWKHASIRFGWHKQHSMAQWSEGRTKGGQGPIKRGVAVCGRGRLVKWGGFGITAFVFRSSIFIPDGDAGGRLISPLLYPNPLKGASPCPLGFARPTVASRCTAGSTT